MSEMLPLEAGACVLASVTDYDGLVKALRARSQALHINLGSAEAAALTGLPDRYLPKLLGQLPSKRFGAISLGPALALLGIKLLVVEDPETMTSLAHRRPCMKKARTRKYRPRRYLPTSQSLQVT